MTIQKFDNVQNMHINGKKYSACDCWVYDDDKKAWVYDGKLYCKGWYKKGVTIFNKCQDEMHG